MIDKQDNLSDHEAPIEQWLKSAYGPEARPGAAASQRVYGQLLAELRAREIPEDFPDAALTGIGILLFLGALWATTQGIPLNNLPVTLLRAGAIANFIFIPVSIVIIKKRAGLTRENKWRYNNNE